MNYNVSKELFKAVMKDDIFNNSGDWGQLTEEKYINKSIKEIDYDRLFFDCKKWAYNQGYIIFSSQQKTGWAVFIQTDSDGIIASFEGLEHQACFDACQWILNKDKQ